MRSSSVWLHSDIEMECGKLLDAENKNILGSQWGQMKMLGSPIGLPIWLP